MPGPDDGRPSPLDEQEEIRTGASAIRKSRAEHDRLFEEQREALERNAVAKNDGWAALIGEANRVPVFFEPGQGHLLREGEDVSLDLLHAKRFERARRILEWLMAKSHYMEPPSVRLFHDGSGTLLIGAKTLEDQPELRKQAERVVGSVRWGTRNRENGAVDIFLEFCTLELEAPIPED